MLLLNYSGISLFFFGIQRLQEKGIPTKLSKSRLGVLGVAAVEYVGLLISREKG